MEYEKKKELTTEIKIKKRMELIELIRIKNQESQKKFNASSFFQYSESDKNSY